MAFVINAAGNALTPFDCFLLLRGTKTLAIRMDRQQTTAMLVAQMLDRLGFKVHYPGLANHPNRDVHERIAHGFGAVLSFTTGDKALSERIVGATALWGISVSFGCVNSLISMPCVMSYVFYVSFSSTLSLIFSLVDTRLLTLLRVLLVASRRTSSDFALVLKTPLTSSTIWNVPFWRLEPSPSPQARIHTKAMYEPFLPRALLFPVPSRNLHTMTLWDTPQRTRTENGLSAHLEKSSFSANMPSCTVW